MKRAFTTVLTVFVVLLVILPAGSLGAATATIPGGDWSMYLDESGITARNATFNQDWSNGATTSLARYGFINGSYLYVASSDGLFRMNATDGSLNWSSSPGSGFRKAKMNNDGYVYAGTFAGEILKVNRHTGAVVWTKDYAPGDIWSITISESGNIIFTAEGGGSGDILAKIDTDGNVVSSQNTTTFGKGMERTDDGTYFFVSWNNGTITKHADDFSRQWSYTGNGGTPSNRVEYNNSQLFISYSDGDIEAITDSDAGPSQSWKRDALANYFWGNTWDGDGNIYFAGYDGSGMVLKVDRSTGSTVATYRPSGAPIMLTSDSEATRGPTGGGGATVNSTIELEIDPWMPFNSTQNYRVILNETNTTTGDTNLTDVTATANVTIYNISNTSTFNEPIATVNNTTDTIRSYNETGVVAVNATYDGNTVANASNLTVGNRNLSNIGIMPPEQWICAFLTCDENPSGGDNPHNIGSSMQWLLLIIVIMVAATRFVENPWAGVGTGIMFSIFIWVLEFIDLGSVLVTVFSGLLIGVMMARTQMGRGVTRDNEQSGIAATQVQNRNE